MPAKFLMTWDASNRRWRKLHRGQRFVISCRQLDVPESKEASYQAANAWWITKQAEIDGQKGPHRFRSEIDTLKRRLGWAQKYDSTLAESITETLQFVTELNEGDLHPSLVADIARGSNETQILWQDRLERDQPEPVPVDRTVGGQVQGWLAFQLARVKASEITPANHNNTRLRLLEFERFLGSATPVERINQDTWREWHKVLLERIAQRIGSKTNEGWSREYARKVLNTSRSFVRHLWESDLIPLPKNLSSQKISSPPQSVPTMTLDEVRNQFSAATERVQLYVLLMANCGMTPVDISGLRNSEVEWEEGRIIRKRSKTSDEASTPIVNYKLWTLTFDLLKKHRAQGEFTLLTTTGRKLVDERWEGDKLKSKDAITMAYRRLRKGSGVDKPLKLLRKTSATLLEGESKYERVTTLFLGHSPRSMKDKHYAAPPQVLFDEAVTWLGEQYRFGASESDSAKGNP